MTEMSTDKGILGNPNDIANAFNNHYINITTMLNIKHSDEKASVLLNNLKLEDIASMVAVHICEVEAMSKTKSLKMKGTSGYGRISSKTLC